MASETESRCGVQVLCTRRRQAADASDIQNRPVWYLNAAFEQAGEYFDSLPERDCPRFILVARLAMKLDLELIALCGRPLFRG